MNRIVDFGMVTKILGFTPEIFIYSARITFPCFHVYEHCHSKNKTKQKKKQNKYDTFPSTFWSVVYAGND